MTCWSGVDYERIKRRKRRVLWRGVRLLREGRPVGVSLKRDECGLCCVEVFRLCVCERHDTVNVSGFECAISGF